MSSSRIVCISANPAIDHRLRFRSLAIGRINRATSAEPMPGGKAAHVALAARAIGARTLWLGFLGGATGDDFAAKFSGLGIELACVRTRASTRTNLELLEDSGRVTEVLEPGEQLGRPELEQMAQKLECALRGEWRGATVMISGSLPLGVSPYFYAALIAVARVARSRVIIDTSGDALRTSLSAHPAFVKPNKEEVENLLRRRLKNRAAILEATRELIRRGAESAAVSIGAEGLIWLESKNGPAWFARPPQITAISSVGCGDATVAGFAIAAAKQLRGEEAVRLATACGAANCLASFPGRISRKNVRFLTPQIEVHKIQ